MEYTNKSKSEVLFWLKSNLDTERYSHSVGCSKCALELVQQFKLNSEYEKKAEISGLLHDCAKCFSKEELENIIKKYFPNSLECELNNYKTLHAPASAHIAEHEFGVNDEEILSSIRWHTLGAKNMNEFEKIIFLADKIEEHTRCSFWRKEILETLDFSDIKSLDKALLKCYKSTIKSLVERDLEICMPTIEIYNNLLKNVK